jgi:hypothetical protein
MEELELSNLKYLSQVWWYMHVIPAGENKAERSRAVWATIVRPCLKKEQKI